MKNKKVVILTIFVLLISFLTTTGFTFKKSSHTLYHIYLGGESIGIIESKDELEDYINKKQESIKNKYKVDQVYMPSDLKVIKEITFSNNIISVEELYKKIESKAFFTIPGYAVTIRGNDVTDKDGNVKKGTKQVIYVLDRQIFVDAVDNIVKSFITEEDYNNFANNTQKKIEDVGKIIEKIYIDNKITIRKQNVPTNGIIYQDSATLSKYLLFGTIEPQKTYKVKAGDTIEEIAEKNRMSTEEFLIANTAIKDVNSLLYPGQIVTLGILKPQFDVVEQDHVVFYEKKKYTTKTVYDEDEYVGYSKVKQKGSDGLNKVTQKIQKVNGATNNLVTVSTEVIKSPVEEIIIKGSRPTGWGSVIATKGEWGWPTACSSITSNYGWRWGALHDGVDIACGYGANIFAAQDGVVVTSRKKTGNFAGGYGDSGEYVIIDHENGYYTVYAHMCPGCRRVKEGDRVVKGQIIGGQGATGWATGVHLHFSIYYGVPYRGGQSYNPLRFY